MKNAILSSALIASLSLSAATVGPDWCVVYPGHQKGVVLRVLKIAAEEVRDDINEATGLELKAVPVAKKGPFYIQHNAGAAVAR